MRTQCRFLLPILTVTLLGPACGTVHAAGTGSITGALVKMEPRTTVFAIDRDSGRKYPGKMDAATGCFTIDGLPLGAQYDCILDCGAARLEGVSLKVPHSDYEQEQPLSKEEVEAIKKIAQLLNQFEDQVEVLVVQGNIQHAAVVLNKKRTKPFYESKPGEMIWRLELWHFQKPEDHWIKDPEELGVVFYRERLQTKDFDKKALTLDPALGGVELTEKEPKADLGRVEPPAKEAGIRLRALKTENSGTRK